MTRHSSPAYNSGMMRFGRSAYQKTAIVIVSFFLLAAAFRLGMWYADTQKPASERVLGVSGQQANEQFAATDFNLFWDVWSRLEEKFADKTKIDRQKLVYGAISGLVRAVKDPYTEFFPPAESQQFQQDIRGSFGGIGAEIGIKKGIVTVIAPLKGNPAERAGIKAGDKIFKVDDTLTGDLNLDEAVRLIRGSPGTKVRLTIMRDSFDRTREFAITREIIKVRIVDTEVMPDGIFVIKLHHFTENAAEEFRRAVQEFLDSHSQKLILDLRNNPGGYLTVATDIGSWFAAPGEIIARERYGDGKEDLYRSSGYQILKKVPAVVLVNEGSASASEIVAGALRDLNGTKLIGAKTFGKGSVQEVINLSGGSSLKVTIAKWLTPNGAEIDGKGLEPDIKVEIPEDKELKKGEDPVMEKAVEVLRRL